MDEPSGNPFDPRIDDVLQLPADMPEEFKHLLRCTWMFGYCDALAVPPPTYEKRYRRITWANWVMGWISGFFLGTIARVFLPLGWLDVIGYGALGPVVFFIGWQFYKIRKERRLERG